MTQESNSYYSEHERYSESLKFILEGAGLGTWEWNLIDNQVVYNDIWFQLLGYKREDFNSPRDQLWSQLIHPEDKAICERAFSDHINGKSKFYKCEIRLKQKNGTYRWIQDSGKIIERDHKGKATIMAGIHMDIDERKQNELLLRKSQDLLNRTNEVAKIGTWEVDLIKEQLYWSPMTKAIHEVPEDFIPDIATAINFYKEGQNRNRIRKIFEEATQSNEPYDEIFEIVTFKGNRRWIRTIGVPIFKDSECVIVNGIFQDVTDQQDALLTIQELLDTTKEQNDRLLNFAHIVSHNLHSHSGNMTMLLKLYQQEEENTKAKIFEMMVKAAENLEQTIIHLNDVIAMSSLTIDNNVEVPLKEAIENTLASLAVKLDDAQIQLKIEDSICVMAIPAYLDSTLLNIINNAFKYKSENRPLELSIQAKAKCNDYVEVKISDNGIGIDLDSHRDKIFGLYKTFHPSKSSKGIGLFISKNQIETMGGSITVESKLNKGTTFVLNFKSCLKK